MATEKDLIQLFARWHEQYPCITEFELQQKIIRFDVAGNIDYLLQIAEKAKQLTNKKNKKQ